MAASEKITLDLELVNKVTQPARSAAAALRMIDTQAKKAEQAMNGGSARQARAVERSAQQIEKAQMRSAMSQMRATQKAMREEQRAAQQKERDIRRIGLMQLQAQKMNADFERRHRSSGGFFSSFREKLPFRSIGDYAKGAFWGNIAAQGVTTIAGAFVDGAKTAVSILSDGVTRAFKAGADREQLELNYRFLLGGKDKGNAALADIERFSGKTRYDDDEIAEMMRPIFNAGMRGTSARSAFAAASDLNAAGLGDTRDFIDQITRIKLKGGVQGKQLVGMGVDVRAFSKSLATALHTDVKSAMERAQNGAVDPQLLLNKIYEGIEARQGGQLGTASEAMGQTMGARWHKLSMLPDDYLKAISHSPEWDKLSGRLGGILEDLDPSGPKGQKIIASLLSAFDRLSTLIQKALTPENIDRFVSGLEGAAKAAGKIADAFATIFGSYMQASDDADYFNKLGGGDSQKGVAAALHGIDPSKRELADSAWEKVSKAENIGWWRDLNMDPDERRSLIAQGYSKGEIFDDEFAAYGGTPSSHKPGAMLAANGGGVTVNQNGQTFNVVVAPGEDPKEAGKRFGEGLNATTVRQMERAAQERGAL